VVTWPASIDQLPPMMDYDIRHGRTYMYFKGKPLYPFGHGLSYTSFRFAHLRTDRPVLAKDGTVTVSLDVTNTGKLAGDAVPQLYVSHPASKVARPMQQLAGFQRVHLAPGETKTVRIPLKAATLSYWNGKALTVEQEPIELRIGSSAADIALRRTLPVR
jgi:beta-glucosidase